MWKPQSAHTSSLHTPAFDSRRRSAGMLHPGGWTWGGSLHRIGTRESQGPGYLKKDLEGRWLPVGSTDSLPCEEVQKRALTWGPLIPSPEAP